MGSDPIFAVRGLRLKGAAGGFQRAQSFFCGLAIFRTSFGLMFGTKSRNVSQNLHFLHDLEYIMRFLSLPKRP